MFLQRLELQGFKSFANKTILDFPDGVTAVVGPNGSGKSNVTDAIRWILGEREAKSLRGAKSDDLIFAGTDKKARSGFAQASLYFDNSSGIFPIEYKEVVITRRIDRDGESKFYINQMEMRLKDVIDFFARARLGARGLNIISQGESDAFLRASPLEKRELIEEILGLKEFLLKKKRATRELFNTSLNMDKVKTSLEELKPHLQMLRRTVKRYEERNILAEELKSLENQYFGGRVGEIVKSLSKIEPQLANLDLDIENKKAEVLSATANLKNIESSQPETKNELEKIRLKRRDLISERMNLSPKVISPLPMPKVIKKPVEIVLKEIKESAEKILASTSVDELREVLQKIIFSIDDVFREVKIEPAPVLPPVKDEVYEAKVLEFNKLFEELDALEISLSKGMEEFNRSFKSAMGSLALKKGELGALIEKRERLVFEKEKLKYKEIEIDNQLKAIGKNFDDYKGLDIENKDFDTLSIERRIYRLRNDLGAIGSVDESIVKEAKDTEDRFNFLTNQITELEKASSDLKSLIKELEQKIYTEFSNALLGINNELGHFAKVLFGGGEIALRLENIENQSATEEILDGVPLESEGKDKDSENQGIVIDVTLPKKRIRGLEVLSGGERSLLSVAILFGLISISPPPFIVVDEVDAPLDEHNARKLGDIWRRFDKKTQFIIVTHNRATMEAAGALYGVTMGEDGASRVVSLKLVSEDN